MKKNYFVLVVLFLFSMSLNAQNSLTQYIDKSINPGDDFFQYANGVWLNNNPVPSDKTRWGAFDVLRDSSLSQLSVIVTELLNVKKYEQGSPTQKVGDFYRSGMSLPIIEQQGILPIIEYLDIINSSKNISDIQSVIAIFQTLGIRTLFSISADADPDNSSIMMTRLWQGGLSLPEKDYYFKTDEKSVKLRENYKKYISNMFLYIAVNQDDADKYSDLILNLETQLAKASNSAVENHDPQKTNNRTKLEDLKKLSPAFNWDLFLEIIGYPNLNEFNVGQPEYFKELSNVMTTVSVDDWKVFLKWKLINSTAEFLSKKFYDEQFDFYSRKMRGQQEPEPRWKTVLGATSGSMGELLGQIYVSKYFPPEAKQRMVTLIENLRKSFREMLKKLSWMSEDTKKFALEKLDAIDVKVGYPNKWKDYSKLNINSNSYVKNVLAVRSFNFRYGNSGMDKIGTTSDRTVWQMSPQTVNAYYESQKNEIVFPAAILQPPFFDLKADDAVNYGAIGVVIGHEITHGFDNNGRQYDKVGNLKDWWTSSDGEEFKKRAKLLSEQYSSYEVLPGAFINGDLTLGENIADQGGLNMSLNAYRISLGGKDAPVIDGLSGNQRFFLSYANIWRQNIRDEALRTQVQTDSHSPGKYRVNGALFNVKEFYEAFPEIKSGDKLFRPVETRPIIWGE